MKLLEDGDTFELSTGWTFYANNGILGLGVKHAHRPEWFNYVDYGADGSEQVSDLTDAERAEIATYMMDLWKLWGRV